MKKQILIYALAAIVFFSIMLIGTGCAGSRGGYACPATKGMSGYR